MSRLEHESTARTSFANARTRFGNAVPPVVAKARVGSHLAGGRLHVLQVLGQGGMGIVYRAFDAERQKQVALKTMSRVDAVGIYALKREFRALADVQHPNLVRLFELFNEAEHWFFTMELVAGVHFDKWVRPGGRLDEGRLRPAFAQLLSAIGALHALGKVHCDIKPSNTLVTDGGHVVVLDFGLVAEPRSSPTAQTLTQSIVGTPAYLAPEQAHGDRPSVASDLYSLGVLLFEALTGQLPFEGTGAEMMLAKQYDLPQWPRAARRTAPDDLVELCDRLLARDPGARPGLDALRARFAGSAGEPTQPAQSARPPLSSYELVGRSQELAQMRAAYLASCSGASVVLEVSGESGIGKTAVCDSFLEDLRDEGHAVVLRGRCNERESVPFKALDALIDGLSRHLRRLSAVEAASLLPRDAAALATLFPVLERVEVLAHAPNRTLADPHEQQRRAYAALHELLGRMRDRAPLVILIDDLQWTDRDSSQLLRYLLLHNEPLQALIILCHRAQAELDDELLGAVLDAARSNRSITLERIALAPLSGDASAELANRLLAGARSRAGEVDSLGERIGQEAGGNPFLIGEFARFAAHAGELDSAALSLGSALEARVAGLSGAARKLLSLLSVAGHPLPHELAFAAAGASHDDLDALLGAHLVRWNRCCMPRKLELYHDRIRESFRELLAKDEVRGLFGELARACADRADVDADLRCDYLEGAGDREGAAAFACKAADQAAAALAFDHAAHLYHKALELGAYNLRTGLHLTTCWANALANAGRSAESASAYASAALLAHGDENLELRRRSAEQLLIAGHAAVGLALLEDVSASLGLNRPSRARLGPLGVTLALGRLRLSRLPGLHLRAVADDPRSALRLELLQTAVVGRQCYAQSGAAEVALEYLHEALRMRDPRHIVWALGSLAIHVESRSFYPELLDHMSAVSEADGRPELRGLVFGLRGFLARRSGQNRVARGWFAKALAAYAECVNMQWQIDMMHVHDQASATACGDYAELMRTTPVLAEDAFQRGRVWTGATLSGFWGMPAWIARDDAAGYRRQLERARSHWQHHASFLTLDRTTYGLHRAEVMLAIYERDPLHGLWLLEERDSTPMKVTHRRDHEFLRGLCGGAALGAARLQRVAVSQRERDRLRALVERCSSQQRSVSKRPFAHMLAAVLELERSDHEAAAHELGVAAELFDGLALPMSSVGARRRQGQLLGGSRGSALVARADTFLREQGVVDHEALNELLCPGCAAVG